MTAEVVTLVRLPISEAVETLRKQHNIKEAFSEVRLEDNFLAFYFVRATDTPIDAPIAASSSVVVASARPGPSQRRRRARKKRNRMKTRGWPIVTKIVNRKGQTAVIYKPFVDALSGEGLSRREQKNVVQDILKANGNKPSDASVEYFLENTVEYLKRLPVEK